MLGTTLRAWRHPDGAFPQAAGQLVGDEAHTAGDQRVILTWVLFTDRTHRRSLWGCRSLSSGAGMEAGPAELVLLCGTRPASPLLLCHRATGSGREQGGVRERSFPAPGGQGRRVLVRRAGGQVCETVRDGEGCDRLCVRLSQLPGQHFENAGSSRPPSSALRCGTTCPPTDEETEAET